MLIDRTGPGRGDRNKDRQLLLEATSLYRQIGMHVEMAGAMLRETYGSRAPDW